MRLSNNIMVLWHDNKLHSTKLTILKLPSKKHFVRTGHSHVSKVNPVNDWRLKTLQKTVDKSDQQLLFRANANSALEI